MRMKLWYVSMISVAEMVFHFGCTPAKTHTAQGKKIPETIAITPSTFRCSATVLENNNDAVNFKITKMLEEGSSLFYSVSAGDTIEAVFHSANESNFSSGNAVELLIEERIKMNSEKPEFIIRQVRKQ